MFRRVKINVVKYSMVGSVEEGMQAFDNSVDLMYKDGEIPFVECLNKADSRDGLALKIRLSEGATGNEFASSDPYGIGV